MSAEYDVSTLAAMAEIPEDRWPAFIAEMLELLAWVRQMKSLDEETGGAIRLAGMKWKDDGKPGLGSVFIRPTKDET